MKATVKNLILILLLLVSVAQPTLWKIHQKPMN